MCLIKGENGRNETVSRSICDPVHMHMHFVQSNYVSFYLCVFFFLLSKPNFSFQPCENSRTLVYFGPNFFVVAIFCFELYLYYIQDEKWRKKKHLWICMDFGYIQAYGRTTRSHPKKKTLKKWNRNGSTPRKEWESVRLFIFSVDECGQKGRIILRLSALWMLKMWGGIKTQAPFNWFLALHLSTHSYGLSSHTKC